MAGYLYI